LRHAAEARLAELRADEGARRALGERWEDVEAHIENEIADLVEANLALEQVMQGVVPEQVQAHQRRYDEMAAWGPALVRYAEHPNLATEYLATEVLDALRQDFIAADQATMLGALADVIFTRVRDLSERGEATDENGFTLTELERAADLASRAADNRQPPPAVMEVRRRAAARDATLARMQESFDWLGLAMDHVAASRQPGGPIPEGQRVLSIRNGETPPVFGDRAAGMNQFYDRRLVQEVERLIKPFGGRLETRRIHVGEGRPYTFYAVPITQGLREAVEKGLPLFSRRERGRPARRVDRNRSAPLPRLPVPRVPSQPDEEDEGNLSRGGVVPGYAGGGVAGQTGAPAQPMAEAPAPIAGLAGPVPPTIGAGTPDPETRGALQGLEMWKAAQAAL
jgi:hypothetical protein